MMRTMMMPEFEQLMKKEKVFVIDVREDDEFEEGHIPGAVNYPLSKFMQYVSELDKKQKYYMVCYSGGRSDVAAKFLDKQGFDIVNIMGGMSVYKGPIE